jgi:hypothetical protein
MSVSYIDLLGKVENQIEEQKITLDSHLMICLEINSDGMPAGQVIKVSADPYEVLGMIDVAMHKLDELRNNIIDKFKKTEKASRIMNGLPKNIMDKLNDFENELKDAMEDKDIKALEDLKNKILGDLDKDDDKKDSDDNDDFDINDFKSGF